LEGNPHVTTVRKLRKREAGAVLRMIRELRQRHYHRVIDFQGLIKSAAIAMCCGARDVVGFQTAVLREKPAALAYKRQIAAPVEAHIVEHYLALTESRERVFEFPLPAGERFDGDFLAVSLSAGRAA